MERILATRQEAAAITSIAESKKIHATAITSIVGSKQTTPNTLTILIPWLILIFPLILD